MKQTTNKTPNTSLAEQNTVERFVTLLAGRYWHKLTDDEFDKLQADKTTWGEIMENLKQPDWCNYPGALEGGTGCWSLIDKDLRKKINRKYCGTCDCYRKTR